MQMQLHASVVDAVHMNERLGKKKKKKIETKTNSHRSSQVVCFLRFCVSFHYFAEWKDTGILHRSVLCQVIPRSQSFSFGWLSISTFKKRMLKSF